MTRVVLEFGPLRLTVETGPEDTTPPPPARESRDEAPERPDPRPALEAAPGPSLADPSYGFTGPAWTPLDGVPDP